jgi:Right handed beta helix region
MKLISAVFTFLALAVLVTAPANAQATRTWVSGVGDDVNPCSRTAPCKTFAGAISKTAAGGEISVLDPGGYGVVTITKALTLSGDGTLGSILSAGTNGVIVNAGVNDRVVLRNLSINGVGTGLNGIRYIAGKSLTVDNVTIAGVTGRGIDMSVAATSSLYVTNTRITRAGTGIFVSATAGSALAMIDNTNIEGVTNGIEAGTGGRVTATSSVISGNASNGILASGATSVMNVEACQIAFNDIAGVNVTVSGGVIRLSNNHIYNNTASILITAGGVVSSALNNKVSGNGPGASPNGPAIVIQ